ncbi:MAG: hypothetical protein HYV29_01690 [Ignavibacteriales bacterium]|nr:hypothetical protein [Ignavibacteriales bacterium]
MSIELNKECPYGLHSWHPIIEGTQTVGLICMNCAHTVREEMQYSNLAVSDGGALVEKYLDKYHPAVPDKIQEDLFYFYYWDKRYNTRKKSYVTAFNLHEAEQCIAARFGEILDWDKGIEFIKTEEYMIHRKDRKF